MINKVIISCLCIFVSAGTAFANSDPLLFQLSYEEAEKAIAPALIAKGTDDDIKVFINGRNQKPLFSHSKPVTAQVTGLIVNDHNDSWQANLLFMSDKEVVSAVPIAGRYESMVSLPVLTKKIGKGEVITQADIEIKSFVKRRLQDDVVTDQASLIGQSPVRTVSTDRPVRTHEIASPAIIKKNSMVKMIYEAGALTISTSGIALEDGAVGVAIPVKNLTSQKMIQATVESHGLVRISPPPAMMTSKVQEQAAPLPKAEKIAAQVIEKAPLMPTDNLVQNELPSLEEEMGYAFN